MLDLLVVAPHPDDGELGCGGTLARAKAEGLSTGILDLTRGEMGSKGTPEEREKEVAEASRILGLDFRGNLGFPDGGLADVPEQRLKLAQALRRLRPRVVFAPLEADRHPDHTRCGHRERGRQYSDTHPLLLGSLMEPWSLAAPQAAGTPDRGWLPRTDTPGHGLFHWQVHFP